MDSDEPIICGHLILHPNKKSKKPHLRYCKLFKASKCGIERLEMYENQKSSDEGKIIPLNNCIKIKEVTPGQCFFKIFTKTETYEFDAMTQEDKSSWIKQIQYVAFPDDSSKITTIEEDNELYCPSGEGIFSVKVLSTKASVKCEIANENCILMLTPYELELKNLLGEVLYTWPYRYIRKYGFKNGNFTFEAGRKCISGEGTFLLEHPNKDEIFRSVALKMKSMKQTMTEPGLSPISADSDFLTGISKKARSRDPVSLSTASSINLTDTMLENRVIPSKPPRKVKESKPVPDNIPDYEPIDRYDEVECRNYAWRTMGVDDVNHSEKEELYTTWYKHKKSKSVSTSSINTVGPKIVTQKPTEINSYNTLQFFGSNTKLNSSYNQVNPPPIPPVSEPISFNDYDEVETCLQGVRVADDSYLGYALVRKDSTSKSTLPVFNVQPQNSKLNTQRDINHKIYNNEPYAVISKSKNV
ncbi:unnamed protein product [Brassicogethes aeneus]|uniref:Insulin receptor substrate 1 n=1 Tax=Brassicogethes aeneus TaxID=1431903 RepID=A0A9P0AXV1_BRAAE|nr:unnamed protein product [Brassicogethes aeneus]